MNEIIRAKTYDEAIRVALDEYKERMTLSVSELASELGTNSTQVSKYLSGKPEGDVIKLENAAEDVLKAAARRISTAVKPFPTNVSESIRIHFDMIRKTNDIGLIHGPAGVGKTIGSLLYTDQNPSAIYICAAQWSRGAPGIERAIFSAVESRRWDRKMTRAEFLVRRLRQSNRLIIIDNAHRLSVTALNWLFDFYDETACPLALVGNPEILEKIKKNDQKFSRIGIRTEVAIAEGRKIARAILKDMAPQHADDLLPMAECVVAERGYLRALKKQILLTNDLLGTKSFAGNPTGAFQAAHTKLIREYKL
ncbi:MAG: AAA family ATPase [Kiritimatiellia bacterium]